MTSENPVAIVTAASKGMGAAIARELRGRGYRLALLARSDAVETLARELDGVALIGSVTEVADLERLVAMTLDRFGRIDAVVNHTGHPPKGDLLTIPDADWHAGLDVLLLNVVRMARLTTPALERSGGGAIVNISNLCRLRAGCRLSSLGNAARRARLIRQAVRGSLCQERNTHEQHPSRLYRQPA